MMSLVCPAGEVCLPGEYVEVTAALFDAAAGGPPESPRARLNPSPLEPAGGGQRPQNSGDRRLRPDEVGILRAAIEKFLTDKCTGFIDKLIGAATGKPYDSKKNLLPDLNRYANRVGRGGIFFSPGIGSIRGSWDGDDTQVLLGAEAPLSVQYNVQSFAGTLLHELLHGLAHSNDKQLSEVLQRLGITPKVNWSGKPIEFPKDAGRSGNAYSQYWGTALKDACFPNA